MNNIEVKISFTDEDRERLDFLTACFKEWLDRTAPTTLEVKPIVAQTAEPAPAVVETKAPKKVEEPAPEAQPEPVAQSQPEVKQSDIQSLVVALITQGKKAAARDIVLNYASCVSDIPADKYAEVYAKLQQLKTEG